MASTVTDLISFSDTGTYGVTYPPNSFDVAHGYQGAAVASGSFDITFDPTKLYLTQSISGVIGNLIYSVTDPYFSSSPLTLNSITSFAFDGAGTLTLYSNPAAAKNLAGSPDIAIGINGWAYGTGSAVWYSQTGFGDTLTTSGGVTITPLTETAATATPLPSAWTMLIAGFIGLGFFAYRGAKKNAAVISGANSAEATA
jgi:hypothetical protein